MHGKFGTDVVTHLAKVDARYGGCGRQRYLALEWGSAPDKDSRRPIYFEAPESERSW